MKNTTQTVENIIDLIRWFEEFQPEDLEQIERILTGLQYVNDEVMNNTLKKDVYRHTKLIKDPKFIKSMAKISLTFLGTDINNRYYNKENNDVEI